MKMKKVLLIVSMFVLSTFVFVNGVNASAHMKISSQDPDPVSPGNYVYVNVKVSNPTDEHIQNAELEVKESGLFQVAEGTDKVKSLGTIPAQSYGDDGRNYVIAKFKLKVDESTPLGLNGVDFTLRSDGGMERTSTYDIFVKNDNLRLIVDNFSVDRIAPGGTEEMSMTVKNVNSVPVRDTEVKLDLEKYEDDIFTVEGSSNTRYISLLEPGETKDITFDLSVSPNAESKPYKLPFSLEYRDSLDNSYDKEYLGSASVESNVSLDVRVDNQDEFTSGSSGISFSLANPYDSTLKGTRVEILPSDDYEVLSGGTRYVGDLNPDDFQTMQTDLFVYAEDDFDVKLKAYYQDSYNNKHEEIFEVPYRIYQQNQLESYGLVDVSGEVNWFNWVFGIVILVLVFVSGMVYGKRKMRKKFLKKKNK